MKKIIGILTIFLSVTFTMNATAQKWTSFTNTDDILGKKNSSFFSETSRNHHYDEKINTYSIENQYINNFMSSKDNFSDKLIHNNLNQFPV